MAAEPSVLQRLKALGLQQKTIAAYIGASPAAVSLWLAGKNPLGEPWLTEARFLLAVLQEHLAQGQTLDSFRYLPTVLMNPGGSITYGGDAPPIPYTRYADLAKLMDVIRDWPMPAFIYARAGWDLKTAAELFAEQLHDLDPLTWQPTARDLDSIRRIAQGFRLLANTLVTALLDSSSQAAAKESTDAHQTP